MIDNKKINQVLLYRFFQRETTLAEEILIRQWKESSPENARRLIEERKMFDALVVADEGKDLSAYRFIAFHKRIRLLVQVAAVIAVAVIASYAVVWTTSQNNSLYSSFLQKIKVPAGQRINLELPDGTAIWLNSLSSIEYSPFEFVSGSRKIRLNGEAYFEVKADKERPFMVETSKGEVEVLGTKFYVEAYSGDDSFTTSLIEGAVKITMGNNSLYLKPNQKAFLNNENLMVSEIKDYDVFRWREGLISFSDEAFAGILKKFEKYYGVEIEVENEQILQARYTGKFRHSDGISYALKVLQRDLNFTFNRNEQDSIIYIK